MSSCKVCNKSSDRLNKCSACKSVYYCSSECQKVDWKSHKTNCFKIGQIPLSTRAYKIVQGNLPFSKISQYLHHYRIDDFNISKYLMLCVILPILDEDNKIASYSCILNMAPFDEFSEELRGKIDKTKRAIFMMYYSDNDAENSSMGEILQFNFE